MGRPRSNTSTSTKLFSVSRFGTKAARATQVAPAGPRLGQRAGMSRTDRAVKGYDRVMSQSRSGYIVLQRLEGDEWRCSETSTDSRGCPRVGRAPRRFGTCSARTDPRQAFAVLPRSEWQLALDH